MARFLSHPANRSPAADASSTEFPQLAPQGLNNYSGAMTRSKMRDASHPEFTCDAALQTIQIAANRFVDS
jgi:hypothetical protein